MKVDDAVETIAKFFNDLISACVPGLVLAIGLLVMHLGPAFVQSLLILTEGVGGGLTMIGLLFALGHTLLAANQIALKPLFTSTKILKSFNEDAAKKRQSYKWFLEIVESQQGTGQAAWDFHDLRAVALSVSAEAAMLGRKFMFISLLCSGVGTALLIICVDYLLCSIFMPNLIYSYVLAAPWYAQATLLFGTSILLFQQGTNFYSRAMTTPFSVAVAEIKMKQTTNESNS
ncbi:hypothetical protein ACSZM1_15740 [Aeromonas veronii]